MGCLVFIVLSLTLFQHLYFVSHEEIPSEEGLKSAFVLSPSQLQMFNDILDRSFLHILASHDFEFKVSICEHLFNILLC